MTAHPCITRRQLSAAAICAFAVLLGACSSLDSARSPDVVYSSNSAESRALQIPPDLTDVSDAEQFIVPGDAVGPITRNTLLPNIDGVRLERGAAGSWLVFQATPEDLWPQVIAFLTSNGYVVARTEPVAGIVSTRWAGAESGGVLRNLIGGESRERVAFRLERTGAGSRLFARRQLANAREVDSAPAWPTESSDPEATGELLARLLVFLGVSEQESRGVISAAQAAEVLDPAVMRTTSAGSRVVVYRGYLTAFEDLVVALERGGSEISTRDDDVGRIAFASGVADEAVSAVSAEGADSADAGELVLSVVPVHISAVTVGVTDAEGRRLPADDERAVLSSLLEDLV